MGNISVLMFHLQQEKQGSSVAAGGAYLAEQCWASLEAVNDTIVGLIPCSPSSTPLVFHAAFQDPQSLDLWLADQAGRLTGLERVLYSQTSSSADQQTAFEQLCQQQIALSEAQMAITQWSLGISHSAPDAHALQDFRDPDPSMVMAVSSCWQGHVPWSLLMPGRECITAMAHCQQLVCCFPFSS